MANRQGLDNGTVLQAAIEIADRLGFEQVTLAALAAKLGVKTPSLYNHIKGLPGLRKQMALLGLARLKEQIIRAALGKSGAEALHAAGMAYVAFVRQQPGLYGASMSLTDLHADPDLQEASAELVALMLQLLSEFKFAEEEALHVVRGFRSIVHGFASLELQGGFRMPLERDESLRHVLDTYLRGLQART